MTKQKQIWGLIGWLVLAYATSAIGAVASINASSFYAELTQPTWAPPGWVFGPVWTVLYGLMGVAAWLVWREGGFAQQRTALVIFLVQLGINALWSWLFFAWKKGGLAFIDILLLIVLVILTVALFWRVKPLSGMLLTPYLLWISFAAFLNYTVWQMNPEVLG